MPTYKYQCVKCAEETEFWQSIHDSPIRKHAELPTGDGCTGSLVKVLGPVRTVRIGSEGQRTREVDSTEKRWSKDMDAYQRLRRDGKQPQRIDGAHRMEATALGDFHLETGMPYTDEQVARSREEVREIARQEQP